MDLSWRQRQLKDSVADSSSPHGVIYEWIHINCSTRNWTFPPRVNSSTQTHECLNVALWDFRCWVWRNGKIVWALLTRWRYGEMDVAYLGRQWREAISGVVGGGDTICSCVEKESLDSPWAPNGISLQSGVYTPSIMCYHNKWWWIVNNKHIHIYFFLNSCFSPANHLAPTDPSFKDVALCGAIDICSYNIADISLACNKKYYIDC